MKRVLSRLKNWIEHDRADFVRTLLLSEGFGFCLCLSCIWGYRLDHCGGISDRLVQSLILALVLGDVLSDLIMCVLAYKRADGEDPDGRCLPRVRISVWALSSALILIAWIPVWLAYWPAVFSYDAEAQLYQIISGAYTTHHPLLHTLIMGGCMKLMWGAGGTGAGMALYVALQMTVMSIMLGWTVAEADRCRTHRVWLIIYVVFLALFPVHGILAVSTTKDVIFSGLVIVFVLLIRRMSGLNTYIGIAVCAAFMILFRNNAVYALVLVIAFIMLSRRNPAGTRRPLIIALAAGCIAGLIVSGGLKLICHADAGSPREALSIPIQQMARVSVYHHDELDPDIASDLDLILDGDVSGRYREHLADPVKSKVNMKSPRLFIQTWIRLGLKYPGEYLDAWAYTTEGAWYIADTSVDRIYGEGSATGFGYLSTDIRHMPEGFEVVPHSYLPGLHDVLERLVSDNCFEEWPVIRFIFAPALYVWISIAAFAAALIRRDRRAVLGQALPLLLYLTILCGPAILVRYMYPYMLCIILPMMDVCGRSSEDGV